MSSDGREKSHSYQTRLRLEFEARKKTNPKLTIRSFARTLDIAPSTLLDVMTGKRHFRWTTAAKVGARLKWSSEQVRSMTEQIAFAQNSELPESAPMVVDAHLNSNNFESIANWHLVAILTLAGTEMNSADPGAIARKLGISTAQVRSAIDYLKETKYIQVANGKMKPLKPIGPFAIRYPSVKVIQYQKTLLKMAADALAKYPPRARLSLIRMIPLNREQLNILEALVWKFYLQLEKRARTMEQKDVYCIAIQCFPVSKR